MLEVDTHLPPSSKSIFLLPSGSGHFVFGLGGYCVQGYSGLHFWNELKAKENQMKMLPPSCSLAAFLVGVSWAVVGLSALLLFASTSLSPIWEQESCKWEPSSLWATSPSWHPHCDMPNLSLALPCQPHQQIISFGSLASPGQWHSWESEDGLFCSSGLPSKNS